MTDRIKCTQCENMILPVTAKHNDGLCGQCFMRARSQALPPAERRFSGKYDDASWHYGGDFPKHLPNEAGATHIGMFVASCILNGMGGSLHRDEFPEELNALVERRITPGAWLIEACDEKFTEEELSDEGNAFALEYYYSDRAQYVHDYEETLCKEHEAAYEVPDTWDTFDKINRVILKRLGEWRKQRG